MSKYLAGCSGDMQKQYTGIELNFFTADSMRLCFHFVLNTGLIAQGCFHYHRTAFHRVKKDLLCSSPHRKSKRSESTALGRGHSQGRWFSLTQGMFHTTWHHAQHISWTKNEEGGRSKVMVFDFPSHYYMWWSSALLEVAEHLFCSACMWSFTFTNSSVVISTHDLSSFYPSDCLPMPQRGLSGCERPSCLLG